MASSACCSIGSLGKNLLRERCGSLLPSTRKLYCIARSGQECKPSDPAVPAVLSQRARECQHCCLRIAHLAVPWRCGRAVTSHFATWAATNSQEAATLPSTQTGHPALHPTSDHRTCRPCMPVLAVHSIAAGCTEYRVTSTPNRVAGFGSAAIVILTAVGLRPGYCRGHRKAAMYLHWTRLARITSPAYSSDIFHQCRFSGTTNGRFGLR